VWNAVADQIKASGETVEKLAADASAQLPVRLSNLKEPIHKADTTYESRHRSSTYLRSW
jgi:hypothetical protein